MKVLETNILQASDVIYWLDGSSHTSTEKMQRLAHPLHIQISQSPKDLTVINHTGKTALLRKPSDNIVEGNATEAQRAFVAGDTYSLSGQVRDPKGFFNPRLFSLAAGAGNGHELVLYPTPMGTRLTAVGAMLASLRWQADASAVAWAMAELTVTIAGISQPQVYRAQADHRGELIIPWPKLPPLPEGETHYNAALSIQALPSATVDEPIDLSTLVAAELESTTTEDAFSHSIGLQLVPGERLVLRSANKGHLTVQPN